MGLLDGSMDTGTMANLALAGGLLSPGSFGQGLSTGLANANAVQSNAADLQLKKQALITAQQEQQQRALAMQQLQQRMQFGSMLMNGPQGAPPAAPPSAPAQPSVMAGSGPQPAFMSSNPTMGGSAPQNTVPAAAMSRLGSMTSDQIAGGIMAGFPKEIVDLWQAEKMGRALPPGWRQNADGSTTYIPALLPAGASYGPGNTITQLQGASNLAALAGATKSAETAATNALTPVPIDLRDRLPGLAAGATIGDLVSPKVPAGTPADMAPNVSADLRINGGGAPATFNAPSVGPFKSKAQLDAENLQATQDVHSATDPVIALRKDILTKSHDANQTFVNNLGDVVNNEAEIVARNNRIQPLLAQLPSAGGFGYDARVQFANKLAATGLPTTPTIAKWIAGGDPASAAAVSNQLSAAAIQTMLDTLNKEGKPNRVMYQALKEQQEGLEAGKPVLQNIMDLQNQLYQQHLGQLGQATDLMGSPTYNPVSFQSQFATGKSQSIGSPPTTTAPTMRYNATSGKIEPVN